MKKLLLIFAVASSFIISTTIIVRAAGDLSGRILLQVEEHGEAWYVNPTDGNRYFLGRPYDAFQMMRKFGLGISNADLDKIPVGLIAQSGADSDRDGLIDRLELTLGTDINKEDTDGDTYSDKTEILTGNNPLGVGKYPVIIDTYLVDRLKGKILIQVQKNGEAWYVNPVNGKRYFLGLPPDAFQIMRGLGLGITNADLNKVPTKIITNSYTSPKNFTVNIPATWTKTEFTKPGTIPIDYRDIRYELAATFGQLDTKTNTGTIIMIAKTEPIDAYGLKNYRMTANEQYKTLIENKDLIVNNHSAHTDVVQYDTRHSRGEGFTLMTTIMIDAHNFYIIALENHGSNALFDSYTNLFTDIIKSFKIL
jgi:hypothetical protein